MIRVRNLTVLVWIAMLAPAASGQVSDSAEFVRLLYKRYANIDPDRGIIDFWVKELRRGTQPVEVHAQVLGSNQTFDNARKDNRAWVRLMYAEVIGRVPEAAGEEHWLSRLRELNNDRVKLAREFLRSAGAELAAPGSRPGQLPQADLPGQLKTTAELLSQSVNSEFPGYQSFLTRTQADNFSRSVAGSQTALSDHGRNPRKYSEAVLSLSNTLDTLERTVAQTKIPAPSTRIYLDQCKDVLAALSRAGNVAQPEWPLRPPVGGGALSLQESRQYRTLLDTLSKDLTAAEATMRVVIRPGWATTRLLNQVGDITAEVDSLRADVRAGYTTADLKSRVQGVQRSVGSVSETIATNQMDLRAVQTWYSVTASLQKVTDELSLKAPGAGGGNVPREVFRAIDQAVAECDALLLAYSPYATYNRSVGRLTTDLTDLKNQYAALRRAASQLVVTRRDLNAYLDAIDQRMKTVGTNWRDVSRDTRLTNTPDLFDLQSADRDLAKLVAAIK